MLWDDKNDSKDWQRLKNLLFLNMFVSNQTRDEILPVLGVLMVAFLIALSLS
jgi:hypothetical protein